MQGKLCDTETPSPRWVVQRRRDIDEELAPIQTDRRARETPSSPECLCASVPPCLRTTNPRFVFTLRKFYADWVRLFTVAWRAGQRHVGRAH